MSADSWRVTLPCTRAEAEAIDAADDLAIDAVLMTTEEVEDDVERWRLDAYMGDEPSDAMLAALRVLVAGMAGKLSGAATATVTIRNLADSADVVVATVDADGNRSAVTVTP